MPRSKRKNKVVATQPATKANDNELHVGKFNLKKNALLWILPLIVLALLLYYLKGLFIAATVNGQPVSRFAIIQDLEKRSGKQTLQSEITKTLLLQEAKKRNIVITQNDIDSELKKIENSLKSQGQSLDQALAGQGMTRQELTTQIEQQLILEKILDKQVKVSDKDVADFIEKNKDSFPEGTTEDEMKKTATSQVQSQKFNTEANNLLESLLKQAKINYFVNYP